MCTADRLQLSNGKVSADFDSQGLVQLSLAESSHRFTLAGDTASLTVNGEKLSMPGLRLGSTRRRKNSLTYTYAAGDRQLLVIYELKPGWSFVSKQLVLTLPETLQPGQFQGLFFENVAAAFTKDVSLR